MGKMSDLALSMDDMLAIVKPHNDKIVAEAKLETALRQNAKMRDLLEELIDDYFDGRVDVVDGSYGEPAPNTEMQWVQRIREALGKSQY